jgi:hypothetical protein
MASLSAPSSLEASTDKSRFLRALLYANAAFSGLSGLILILFNGRIAALTGIESRIAFVALGLLLFGWEANAFLTAREAALDPRKVLAIIGGDLLWVLASVAILAFGLLPLTRAGLWGVAVAADLVAIFAALQYVGLRRMKG